MTTEGVTKWGDGWLTYEPDPGNWRLLILFPVLGMYILPTVPRVGALEEWRSIETTWTVYVTEPS